MKLASIQQFDTAVGLIHRGMRLGIVSHITGIHLKTLRTLHREIHGRVPSPGPMPSSGGIISARLAQVSASVLATLYRSIGGAGIYHLIDMKALLTAYDLYRELLVDITPLPVKPLDITQAWIIARDLQTGAVYFQACRHCHTHYLCAVDAHSPPGCPICALKRREGIR